MAWTSADLDAIRATIAKGEKSCQFADRSVTYRSLAELIEAEKAIAASLATARRMFYVAADQGF